MMNIFITNIICEAGTFWAHGPLSNLQITLKRGLVTFLPTTNDSFGEANNQRGWEDRVESPFWQEARDKGICKATVALKPQKEGSHNSTFTCKNF